MKNLIIAMIFFIAGLSCADAQTIGPISPSPAYLSATSASFGGSLIGMDACISTTVSVPGATSSMEVSLSPSGDTGDGFLWLGFVSSANVVTIKLCAFKSGTPTAQTYNVRVFQ